MRFSQLRITYVTSPAHQNYLQTAKPRVASLAQQTVISATAMAYVLTAAKLDNLDHFRT